MLLLASETLTHCILKLLLLFPLFSLFSAFLFKSEKCNVKRTEVLRLHVLAPQGMATQSNPWSYHSTMNCAQSDELW